MRKCTLTSVVLFRLIFFCYEHIRLEHILQVGVVRCGTTF
jgi:hypothetical protein